jgi:hypothetical protein
MSAGQTVALFAAGQQQHKLEKKQKQFIVCLLML